MTIVDSLKRLAKTITGKDVTGETVAEVVDGLNDNYPEGGGGGSITVDPALSETSENPVQNKAVYARLAELETAIETVNNDFKVEISTDGQAITVEDGVSVADIVDAADAGKHVYAIVTIAMEGVVVGHQKFELAQWAGTRTGIMVSVVFGAAQEDDGAAKPVALIGENTGGDDTWSVA